MSQNGEQAVMLQNDCRRYGGKIMNRRLSMIGIVSSLFVSGVILVFAIKPSTMFFEVQLTVDNQKGLTFSNKSWIITPNSNGIVNFNLMGTVENKDIAFVKLEISPNEEGKWYPQTGGYRVIDKTFIGKAQLGSRQYPMERDQHYGFRLLAQDGAGLLAHGTITAKVHKIYGTSSLLLVYVTLLASLLQIFSYFIIGKQR